MQSRHGLFQDILTVMAQLAMLLQVSGAHMAVVIYGFSAGKAFLLNNSRRRHPGANPGRILFVFGAGDILKRHGWYLEMDINPVKERPGYLGHIALDLDTGAGTALGVVAIIAAGARV